MAMSEKAFAALVRDRLIDTDQVRELLGLESVQAVRWRVGQGWYTGPIVVRDRTYGLWDRVTLEREEAARIEKAS